MKFIGGFLLIFGLIILWNPDIVGYLIGGFFVFIGLNIVLFNLSMKNMKNSGNTDERGSFFKIGKYKIYK